MRYSSFLFPLLARILLSLAVVCPLGACDHDEVIDPPSPDAAYFLDGGQDAAVSQTRSDGDVTAGDSMAQADTLSDAANAPGGDAQAMVNLPVMLVVPGHANPWLAGVPDGGTASGGDKAPEQSPVLVPNLVAAMRLSFTATGGVYYGPSIPAASPDGSDEGGTHPAENGISGSTTPWNSLLGVFLGPEDPRDSDAPVSTWSFLPGGDPGPSFVTLAPALKQIFFIGDGKTGTGSGEPQIFTVPAGATRLFLGTSDGSGWYNNVGQIDVTVTVVPD